MNRVVNVFSFIVVMIYVAITAAIVYDLSVSNLTLKGMPFKTEITAGLALVLLFFGLLRARRRWEGLKDISGFSKFTFETEVAPSIRKSGMIITIIEALFLLGVLWVCFLMYKLHPEYVVAMMIVSGILWVETILFLLKLIKGGSGFRLGVGPNVVAYFNREIHLFYYTGLLRVERYGDNINFQYKDDLNILMPVEVIKKEDRRKFRDALINELKDKNVFIDEGFRTFE